jgi:hypothetical protein
MASATMSLQDMRDFVRDTVDTDDIDLPNALVDTYIIDGADRADAASDSWQFREVSYTFDLVANQQAYVFRGSETLATGITEPLVRVIDVRGPNWSCKPVSHRLARERVSQDSIVTGEHPTEFSVWGDSLYFWPTPSTSGTTMQLLGYRAQRDWVADNDTPDFPPEFHRAISWWAISRAHAREGDPGLAAFYGDQFVAFVERAKTSYVVGLDAQPFIMNGAGRDRFRAENSLGPLIFDWE